MGLILLNHSDHFRNFIGQTQPNDATHTHTQLSGRNSDGNRLNLYGIKCQPISFHISAVIMSLYIYFCTNRITVAHFLEVKYYVIFITACQGPAIFLSYQIFLTFDHWLRHMGQIKIETIAFPCLVSIFKVYNHKKKN